MELLTGSVRHYSWGSRELIATLRGEAVPTQRPEAEVWFGAHPAGSALIGEQPLVDIIAADPESQLGADVRARFGDRLPFLLKLLAAAEPLSLQAHPSLEQAREGFAREDAEGIAIGADQRNYKDDNHKPELIVALTEFEAMAGFRPLAKTLELLHLLNCAELERYLSMLGGEGSREEDDLRALFTTWITIPTMAREQLISEILVAINAALSRKLEPWQTEALENIVQLHERYPFDVGVLGALLLNKFTLQPGEAIFLDAGQLHAYVNGLGVEIMANSDNVLRGGLTPKHVDVPELVRILKFSSLESPQVEADKVAGWSRYATPVDEFQLRSATNTESFLVDAHGPAILLVVAGKVEAKCGDATVVLSPGDAAWIAAQDPEVTATPLGGQATVFLAEVG
ncbi:mannose-6-phosphate isomerase, class I [Corynebacterium epidermidicanis]|uniref:mannose-6-phosphate isomerase n=1 Tax=Corynebacterium epidermidicanis TaxID=1050174 RepID=A0A0G3GSJ3_9CORY|nr:mannose-6-phosphate isomerase, class I [Corynebacterium epidermidicanis]AKK02528.1 mannose-6-phosphate isomerase, type 1 [Corynebacterium epidermidicanis]